jgi:excisionase family DNA binding protein
LEQPLVSLKEAAAKSGLSHSHLRRLANLGRIEAVKLGRDWFTTEEAVANYLKEWELRKHDPFKKTRGG